MAGFFFLALTFIPHHHHQNQLCFQNPVHQSENHCEHQDHKELPGDHQDADNCQDFQFCLTQQIILLPSNHFDLKNQGFKELFQDKHNFTNALFLENRISLYGTYPVNKNGPIAFLSIITQRCKPGGSGLRAPPIA